MKFRSVAVGTLMTVALATASACGSGANSSGASGHDGALSIGIVRFAPSEQVTEDAWRNYRKLAEAKGWSVTTTNPDASVDKAISAMEDMVQKKVNIIFVSVFESKTLTAGIRAAQNAGIPVVSLSGGPATGVARDWAVPDSVEIPELLAKDLGNKGSILALGYSDGLPCQVREKAFDKTIAAGDFEVDRQEVPIPGQLEGGQKFATAWLAKHPKGSGPLAIWACFDDPAQGAIVALKQAGRTDVKVYGYDGPAPAVLAIEKGEQRATSKPDAATLAQSMIDATPEMVKTGPEAKAATEEIPFTLLDNENIKQYLAKNPGATGS